MDQTTFKRLMATLATEKRNCFTDDWEASRIEIEADETPSQSLLGLRPDIRFARLSSPER